MSADHLLYSFPHTVIYSETDARGALSLTSFSSLFQEAALLQAEALGFGETYCSREGRMWVLSRLQVEIDRCPAHRETVHVLTWPKPPQGPLARRDFRITGSDGSECARATSSWLLLDTEKMRPVRPQTVFEGFDFSGVGEAIEGSARKISGTSDGQSEISVVARYSDLDQQDHVNNTRYVRWVLDCFSPQEFGSREPSGFSVNYSRAAGWNDTVALKRSDDAEGTLVRGILQDGSESFAARVRFRGEAQ